MPIRASRRRRGARPGRTATVSARTAMKGAGERGGGCRRARPAEAPSPCLADDVAGDFFVRFLRRRARILPPLHHDHDHVGQDGRRRDVADPRHQHVLRIADEQRMRAPRLHPLHLGVEPRLPALPFGLPHVRGIFEIGLEDRVEVNGHRVAVLPVVLLLEEELEELARGRLLIGGRVRVDDPRLVVELRERRLPHGSGTTESCRFIWTSAFCMRWMCVAALCTRVSRWRR